MLHLDSSRLWTRPATRVLARKMLTVNSLVVLCFKEDQNILRISTTNSYLLIEIRQAILILFNGIYIGVKNSIICMKMTF